LNDIAFTPGGLNLALKLQVGCVVQAAACGVMPADAVSLPNLPRISMRLGVDDPSLALAININSCGEGRVGRTRGGNFFCKPKKLKKTAKR